MFVDSFRTAFVLFEHCSEKPLERFSINKSSNRNRQLFEQCQAYWVQCCYNTWTSSQAGWGFEKSGLVGCMPAYSIQICSSSNTYVVTRWHFIPSRLFLCVQKQIHKGEDVFSNKNWKQKIKMLIIPHWEELSCHSAENSAAIKHNTQHSSLHQSCCLLKLGRLRYKNKSYIKSSMDFSDIIIKALGMMQLNCWFPILWICNSLLMCQLASLYKKQ